MTLLAPRRKRRRRIWRMDDGRLICSACGGADTTSPTPENVDTSICCGAPIRAGAQRQFIVNLSNVYEVLNAGSVGGGKTDGGLMAPAVYKAYRESPAFRGLVFRHWERGGAAAKDALLDFYQRISRPGYYDAYTRGSLNRSDGIYRFAKGGSVTFKHSENLRGLQGPEFQYVWWDELTHWATPDDYLWITTRLRSSTGLPVRIRAGTNPGGPGHEWVRERWGPWLAPNYLSRGMDGKPLYPGAAALLEMGVRERRSEVGELAPPLRSADVLWYLLDERGRETWVPAGTPGALSRSCLRTTTADNVAMNRGDRAYSTRTRAVAAARHGEALHAQLVDDDWMAQVADGGAFMRTWFKIQDTAPQLDGVVRIWDFAYTAPERASARRSRDWTVGALLGWVGPPEDRVWYLLHVIREQMNAADVRKLVQQTAKTDGHDVPIVVPVDYSAGSYVAQDLVAALAGYQVIPRRQQGKKEQRIAALAPQAQAGRFVLVAGTWNQTWIDEACAYPEGRWDDQLDAAAEGLLWSLEQQGPTTAQLDRDLALAQKVSRALSPEPAQTRHRGRAAVDDWGGGGWDGPERLF